MPYLIIAIIIAVLLFSIADDINREIDKNNNPQNN